MAYSLYDTERDPRGPGMSAPKPQAGAPAPYAPAPAAPMPAPTGSGNTKREGVGGSPGTGISNNIPPPPGPTPAPPPTGNGAMREGVGGSPGTGIGNNMPYAPKPYGPQPTAPAPYTPPPDEADTSPAPMPGAPTGQNGTGFVNLQNYLALNRGAVNNMAGKVASNMESQIGAIRNGIDGVRDRTMMAARAASDAALKAGPETLDMQTVTGIKPGNYVSPLFRDKALDTAAEWKKKAETQYTGPTGVDPKDNVPFESQMNEGQRNAYTFSTNPGRAAAFAQAYGGAPYSSGARSLDAALAGGNSRLNKTQDAFNSLRGYLDRSNADAAAYATSRKEMNDAAANQYRTGADAIYKYLDEAAKQAPRPHDNDSTPYAPKAPGQQNETPTPRPGLNPGVVSVPAPGGGSYLLHESPKAAKRPGSAADEDRLYGRKTISN